MISVGGWTWSDKFSDAALTESSTIDSAVNAWLKAGFPADKLNMGVPFYGYKYNNVGKANDGLYQKFSAGSSISYDDEQSIKLKAQYIKSKGLGGAMIWELSQDPERVLLNSLFNALQ